LLIELDFQLFHLVDFEKVLPTVANTAVVPMVTT
jgi:hypothetical protein